MNVANLFGVAVRFRVSRYFQIRRFCVEIYLLFFFFFILFPLQDMALTRIMYFHSYFKLNYKTLGQNHDTY